MNATNGDVFASNHVGAALWRLLVDGQSADAMAGSIAATYDLDAETARTDVAEFLAQLRASSLIVE